jgi:SulP family sulfate permease
VLALVVLVAGSLVGHIPLSALAGVLIATTAHMIKPREMLRMMRLDVTDAVILAVTFILTVWVDLVTAVAVGVVVTFVMRHERIKRLLPPVNSDETLGD